MTTYGSSRWAKAREIGEAGLFRSAGVFLNRLDPDYLRTTAPEHITAFAPTWSDKGVGLALVDPEGALERRNHWEKKTSHSSLVGAVLHVPYADEEKTLARLATFLSDLRRFPSLQRESGSLHQLQPRDLKRHPI